MKRSFVLPLLFGLALVSSLLFDSCKHPTEPQGHKDSTKCDTCHTDTTKHPCDTCTVDSIHHTTNDTSSHNFNWTEYSIPEEASIDGVAVFGPNNIYANGGSLWHFNGTAWEKQTVKTADIDDATLSGFKEFGFAADDLWLIHFSFIYHYHGDGKVSDHYRLTDIGVLDIATDGVIHNGWGTSDNDMFFVGDKGTILHFDGENWIKYPKVTDRDFYSVWGTSHNDVWACGVNVQVGETALAHFDGTSWTNIDPATVGKLGVGNDGLYSIWTCDSASHKKIYAAGAYLYKRTDQSAWHRDSAIIPNRLSDGSFVGIFGLRGNGSNDYVASGDWGFVSHWNGKSWHRYESLFNPNNAIYGTNAMDFKGNTVAIAGFKNGGWIAVGKR